MIIESPDFQDHQMIPKRYTCEGENLSPPLEFRNIPQGTLSFVLIVDDPDAPHGIYNHWITWNLSAQELKLSAGVDVPKQGINSFGIRGYRGPCPPEGKPHRYFFKLYALDIVLDLPENTTKNALEAAMKGHVLETAQLIGLYKR
jgi:Raf kinase inhibitor-like YbhB/YbcL family protein